MLRCCLLLVALLLHTRAALAQQEVPLWAGGAPGLRHSQAETSEDRHETGRLDRYLSYVSQPALILYPVANATGPAPIVLVLPGGGFRYLAIDKEGHEVARWLNAHGVAAAVLKYRTSTEPQAEPAWPRFLDLLAQGDAARAVRLLRHQAAAWNIDPQQIALLGFSAGGTMAIQHTLDADAGKANAVDPIDRQSSLPNSVGLVYSTLPDQRQPKILPGVPFFIAHGAADRKAPVAIAAKLAQGIGSKGGSVELHVFRDADHGFGVNPPAGTVRAWPTLYVEWLRAGPAR